MCEFNEAKYKHIINGVESAGDISRMILFMNGVSLMHAGGGIHEQIDMIFNDQQARKIFINMMSEFDITTKDEAISNLEKSTILLLVISIFYHEWQIFDDETVQMQVDDVAEVYSRLKDNDLLTKTLEFYAEIFATNEG
jgi:DNA helicase IV